MKIHILYSWINLKGTNYRDNLYIITCDYVQFLQNSLKIWWGGGVVATLSKPTLVPLDKYDY